MGQSSATRTLQRLGRQVADDDVGGLAAELAYRSFLALFPFFIFLAALGAFVAGLLPVRDPTRQVLDLLGTFLPSDAAELIGDQIRRVIGRRDPYLLSLGILGAIWFATAATNATIKAMNRVYDIEETRPLWKRYPMAVGLTLLAGLFLTGAFVLLVAGHVLGGNLARMLGLSGPYEAVVSYGRLPLVVLLLLIAAAFTYWVGPNRDVSLKATIPGTLLFTLGWLAATYVFSLYVANFGSYGATYGALGSVAILLIWFYLAAFILLVGAELNAVLEQERDPGGVQMRCQQTNSHVRWYRRPAARAEAEAPAAEQSGRWRRAATALGLLVIGTAIWRLLRSGANG